MTGTDVVHELLPKWRADWIGREYWPDPQDVPRSAVDALDIRRYTGAVRDGSPQWRDRTAAIAAGYPDVAAPPGFVETFSPNYRNYHLLGGTEFLRHLLPFESPWGPDWVPLMLVRRERWTIERSIVVGDVIAGTSTITDIGWEPRRGSRPDMLTVEFSKDYRDADGARVARVVWDMGFLETTLAVQPRIGDPPLAPQDPYPPIPPRPPVGAMSAGDTIGSAERLFDMEAQVAWSAAVWDLGLPHLDPNYAREVYGLPHVVIAGPFVNATVAALVGSWLRPADRLVTHAGRFRRPVVGNDRIAFTARVAELVTNGQPCATVAVTAHNQWGELVTDTRTTCRLAESGS